MYLPTHEQIFNNDLYSCGHNLCTQRPWILAVKCLVCAHKSGKDLTRDQGMPFESLLVLAGSSLIPMEKPVNWLRFLIATVEECKQSRLKIQMQLQFQKLLLQIGLVCGLHEQWKILTLPGEHSGSTTDTARLNVIYSFWRSLQTFCLKLKAKLHIPFQIRKFFSLRICMWFRLCHKSACKISSQTFVKKQKECLLLWPSCARNTVAGKAPF